MNYIYFVDFAHTYASDSVSIRTLLDSETLKLFFSHFLCSHLWSFQL